MFEQKEKDSVNENSKAPRRPLRQYLLSGAAAIALIAAAPAVYDASAEAPVLQKNEASGSLTLNQKAVGLPDFTQLVKRVKPAVVSVRVKEQPSEQLMSGKEFVNPFKGTPFEKLFRNFPDQNNGQWKKVQPKPVEAQGSGFFISADGYIVTNNHVVDGASEVEVVTGDGQTLQAKVVGTDKQTDLALIKVDSDKRFPFVTLAKEKPEIGQWVVAMGNPFGLGGTVTAGIISAEGRDIGEGPYDDFLQIDAPINRGNSGGPTFNLKGEVVGVNTAIFSPSGGSVGIAFDIPASTVESVIPQLQKAGYVRRGWLGVQVQPVTKEIADSLGLKNASGALISEPQPDSPAAKAGLKSGDIITSVDNSSVKDARDLARKIAAMAPGSEVSLSITRNDKPETLTLKIGQMKEQNAKLASNQHSEHGQVEKLGLELAPANEVEGAGSKGVAIVGVEPGGEAASLGIREGDVILKAGSKSVSTPSELLDALKDAKSAGRAHALLLLKHGAGEIYIAVPVSAG
ncbi:MAG: Do family serine endopeptidase [Rhodomicrobium sp.]